MILLAVGSAPCLFEDLDQARRQFPAAEVMTINGSATSVAHAEHVLAGHTDLAELLHAGRRQAFPHAAPWRLHASWSPHPRRRPTPPSAEYPSVTDWHTGVSSGATSAGKAAMIGLKLGFSRVVLCGCPMDGSGYTFDELAVPMTPGMQRIGDPSKQDRLTIRRYREAMAKLAANEFKGRVHSMSGFTRRVLGAP